MKCAALIWALLTFLVDVSISSADPSALFGEGKFEEARKAYSKRLAENPQDAAALFHLAKLSSDGAKSRQLFERVLADHPRSPYADRAQFELAELDFSGPYGRYATARATYRTFLAAHPESDLCAKARYRIGQTFLITNNPDSARVVFEELLTDQRVPEMLAYAKLGVAEAKAMAGDTQGALRVSEPLLDSPIAVLAETFCKSLGGSRTEADVATGNSLPGFWVRVGVFGNPDNIRSLTERLEKAGFTVRDAAMVVPGLRMVLAGPFADSSGAASARQSIEQMEGLRCQVLKR